MAYTKYSLTPADNNAAPPNGAPEGMLPSAVNDTMRDMMSQIRDVGDGIRGGTYTMTAPVITGGSVSGATGSFSTLAATGNVSFDGGSFVFNETGADKDARFEGDTDANLLFLDASTDRIGIGTNSPAQKLDVQAADYVAIRAFSTNSSIDTRLQSFSTNAYGYAGTVSNHPFAFITNNAERMRIDSSGNLLVGLTATGTPAVGYIFNTNGFLQIGRASGAAQSTVGFYNGGNVVGEIRTSTIATLYLTSSDYRLKENIAPMTGALAKVAQLKPVTYTWKSNGEASQGFIAHELAEVCPDAVSGGKDELDSEGKPVYQGIDTSFLVATLTAAIQELKETVDAQAVRIAALENK
jgi:hypothetical protein